MEGEIVETPEGETPQAIFWLWKGICYSPTFSLFIAEMSWNVHMSSPAGPMES